MVADLVVERQTYQVSLSAQGLEFAKRVATPAGLIVVLRILVRDLLAVESAEDYLKRKNYKPNNTFTEFILHVFPEKEKKKRIYQICRVCCPTREACTQWMQAVAAVLHSSHPGGSTAATKKLRVLVNPFSGSADAKSIWKEVQFVFGLANIPLEYTETTRVGHAQEIAAALQLQEYRGLITVSGDGLLNEVVNGLLKRPDWQKARQLPLGIIPGGSGNGLAATLGLLDPLTAAFALAKGHTRPLDLLSVRQKEAHRYCFLAVTWGVISEIDLASEKFRFLGGARFTLAALGEIAAAPTYSGVVRLLPGTADSNPPTELTSLDDHLITGDAPLDAANGWKQLQAEFGMFCATNVSHLGYNSLMAPAARPDDGLLDVVMLRGASRGTMLSFLLAQEDGTHLEKVKELEYQLVRAFAIEPTGAKGCFSLDGEHAPYSPMRCQVHSRVLKLLCEAPPAP
jgi:sphingosine kinase